MSPKKRSRAQQIASNQRTRKWRAKQPPGRLREIARRCALKTRYGLTIKDFEFLRRITGGICPLCRTRPAKVVDHDHSTGKVRGVLCHGCNASLGHFLDDPTILRRAALYLEMFQ